MANREKGVQTTPCPTCETELNLVEMADGGTTAEVCPNCFPASEPEKASKVTARERGTGTDSTKEEE